MDITSYLLGKQAGGGGADLSEYFGDINFNTNNYTPAILGAVKKIPPTAVASNVTSLAYAFQGSTSGNKPFKITFGSNVTDLSYMFSNFWFSNTFDFSGFNTSGVTNMSYMFYSTQGPVNTLNLSNFVTTKVTTMQNMFSGYSTLNSLDISSFETPVLTNTNQMFGGCTKLIHIDMRKMTFDSITSFTNMFGKTANNGVPDNCEIIVKSQIEKDWINTNFSRLTNVKTVAEYEAS